MSCVCTRTAPSAAPRSYTQIEYSKSGEGRATMRERQVGRDACRMVLMPASFVILAIVRSMIRRGRKNTLTPCTTTATSSVAAIISSFGRSFADCLLDDIVIAFQLEFPHQRRAWTAFRGKLPAQPVDLPRRSDDLHRASDQRV